MNGKLTRGVFWALVAGFILVVGFFTIPMARGLFMGGFFLPISGVVLLSLGGALLFLTLRGRVRGLFKKFLILTGACAVGIPISLVLHNAIYGVLIHFFGADFWDRVGLTDEPVFFMMAIFVCPLGFLVGAAGSIVQFAKSSR